MTPRQRTFLAGGVAAASYVAWIATLVLKYRIQVLTGGSDGFDLLRYLDSVLFSLAWIGFPIAGALLAIRRPSNPVGWSILVVGAAMYGPEPVGDWAALVIARGGEVTGALLGAAAVVDALTVLPIAAFAYLLLQFPNGERTRVSRLLVRLTVVVALITVVARALRPAPLDGLEVANPFGIAALPAGDDYVGPLTVVLFGITLVALGRLAIRYRRADGVERKQFQWVLASVATFPPLWVLGNMVEEASYWVGQYMTVAAFDLAFLGFVVALYRAVSKHDLYGIDRLVSRTLTYAGLSVVLVGTYLGFVVGLGAVARAATGESGDFVVALSTLAVAALFQPLRRWMRTVLDRRFNRARYDANRTVEAFGRGLRDQVSLAAVTEALEGAAGAAMHPLHVAVWTRDGTVAS